MSHSEQSVSSSTAEAREVKPTATTPQPTENAFPIFPTFARSESPSRKADCAGKWLSSPGPAQASAALPRCDSLRKAQESLPGMSLQGRDPVGVGYQMGRRRGLLSGGERYQLGRHRRAAAQAVLDRWQRIDVLINNAGIVRDAQLVKWNGGSPESIMSEEMWDSVINVNLKGVFLTTRAVVPHMISNGGGVILSAASVVGLCGNFRSDQLRGIEGRV